MDGKSEVKSGTASRSDKENGQDGQVSAKLLSRAQSILKTANLSRADSSGHVDGGEAIKTAVAAIHREKTSIENATGTVIGGGAPLDEVEEVDDDEMKMLMEMTKKGPKELTDSDFDTDLEEDFDGGNHTRRTERNKQKSSEIYLKTCKKLGRRPIPSILEDFKRERNMIRVTRRSMSALDILALSNSLLGNDNVEKLFLDDNEMGDEGAMCLAWLIGEKGCKLQILSLAENMIEDEGIRAIGDMMMSNRTITHLNLSGNCVHERNVALLAEALKDNKTLVNLNLSYNDLGDVGMRILAPGIMANEVLQSLDLSWNKIRPEGGVVLGNAMKDNIMIKRLQLRMNGISDPGATFFARALKENSTLIYLDLTFNRIGNEGGAEIAKALEKNESLHYLVLHSNPMGTGSAARILEGIKKNPNSGLWKLDMSTISILVPTVDIIKALEESHPSLTFLYGMCFDAEAEIESHYNHLHNRNPMAVVKEYIEKEGLRLIDFFKQFDKDRGGSISKDEFRMGLLQAQVAMSEAQIEDLIDILDRDGDGEINYVELVEGDKEFRRKMMRKKLQALQLIQKKTFRRFATAND